MVGGQHAPIALNKVGASPEQAVLDQEPDSPSPLVLKATDKLDPGVQAKGVVKDIQKFHIPAFELVAGSPMLLVGAVPGSVVSQYHPGPQFVPLTIPTAAG